MHRAMSRSFATHGGARRGAGRPKIDASQRRTRGVKASLTEAQWSELQAAATAAGMSPSELLALRADVGRTALAASPDGGAVCAPCITELASTG